MTASKTDIPQRVKQLQVVLDELLAKHNASGEIELEHDHDAFVMEGGWVHLVVRPQSRGARAYQYVQLLGSIETELRKRTNDSQVLLVPAIPD